MLKDIIFDKTQFSLNFWNKKYEEIMTLDDYKLGYWNQFKNS